MEIEKKITEKRNRLMDQYTAFVKKTSLTEEDVTTMNNIKLEIIGLDFEIENLKYTQRVG